jgi:hypothetical protein
MHEDERSAWNAVEDADERDAMATDDFEQVIDSLPQKAGGGFGSGSRALVVSSSASTSASAGTVGFLVPGGMAGGNSAAGGATKGSNLALALYAKMEAEKPEFHPPWKLFRVVSGHTGWVREACAVLRDVRRVTVRVVVDRCAQSLLIRAMNGSRLARPIAR